MTTPTTNVHHFRVFIDEHGKYGDAASVVVDEGKHISYSERVALTRKLATSETAFINDITTRDISIVHYQGEVDFAGTVALATSWLLTQVQGKSVTTLRGRKGDIATWQDNGLTWVRADLSTMPPWHHKQLENAEAIELITLTVAKAMEHTMVWAWIDETKGLIRARTFASDWDIPEAQGNGSGSMMLAARLMRDIKIKHGEGSIIFAKPNASDQAVIGGRVVEVNKDGRRI